MEIVNTPLKGAFLFKLDKKFDERGFFLSVFNNETLKHLGIFTQPIVQTCFSYNHSQSTLRGLHYQVEPKAQEKWVLCTKGSLFDVIVDLRKDSETFGQSFSVYLSQNEPQMLFVPKGFAHGYITLEDQTEVFYQLSELQYKEHERIVRWNDEKFAVSWPCEPKVISPKDKDQHDFCYNHHLS